MDEPSILSLVPSAMAIIVAVATRRVVLALATAVFVGMTVVEGFNPIAGLLSVFERGVFVQLTRGLNPNVLVLICVIGGFVHLLDNSGGMSAFAARITRRVRTSRQAQIAVLFTGIAIFFTDSGNSLILGPLFRPVFDKLNMAREKLAFVLDATSSPVCVLVPFITWGAYIMSLIDQGYERIGMEVSSLEKLLGALPYQFYPLLALCSVAIFAGFNRDFGPMKRAQRRTANEGDEQQPSAEVDGSDTSPSPGAVVVLVPLALVFVTVASLFAYYYINTGGLAGAQVNISLLIGYLTGSLVCAFLLRWKVGVSLDNSATTFGEGIQRMSTIVIVLLLAWSLGEVCKLLHTSDYIAHLLGDGFPGFLLPALIFFIGAGVSLSTGSSYGTFAILMPIAIPLAHTLGAPMPVTVAAVLSGGVLGDHCSPISDTTILSSMATGCEHADHVNTQFPYALLTGVAALSAFVLAGLTQSVLSLLLGIVVLIGLIWMATRRRHRKEVETT